MSTLRKFFDAIQKGQVTLTTGPAPQPEPPERDLRKDIENTVGGVGLILALAEAAGASTATLVLMPIGAFFVGLNIAEEREKIETALESYRMKFTGSAALAAQKIAVARAFPKGPLPLNDAAKVQIKARWKYWRDKIEDELEPPFSIIRATHQVPDNAVFQKIYDKVVTEWAEDLARIYSDR